MGAKRVKIGEKPQMTAESRLPELPPQSHSEQIAPIKPPMSSLPSIYKRSALKPLVLWYADHCPSSDP